MYAKFCVSQETATNFMRLFVNRRAYGMQAVRSLRNGSVPYFLARDWQTKVPKPLDADVVRKHLNGDITINLFAINPETQRSKWVAIDADFDGAIEALLQLQHKLKQDGVEAALEQSRRGGHLWIFAEAPLLAAECRIYIYNLALRLDSPGQMWQCQRRHRDLPASGPDRGRRIRQRNSRPAWRTSQDQSAVLVQRSRPSTRSAA
jgi:hypothetical protein